jgi:hypothetical protein
VKRDIKIKHSLKQVCSRSSLGGKRGYGRRCTVHCGGNRVKVYCCALCRKCSHAKLLEAGIVQGLEIKGVG